jgi:shikimate 5-dehydrogenase
MKWCFIGESYYKEHFDFLSQTLTQKGIENQFTFIETPHKKFEKHFKIAENKYDHILLDVRYQQEILQFVRVFPSHPVQLHSAEYLIRKDQTWWPRSTLEEALKQLLGRKFPLLEIKDSALIVGTNALAWQSIGALLRLGYNKFSIADIEDAKAQSFIEELKQVYFSAQIAFIPRSQLVHLPGSHSIIVNATQFTPENDLLEDLFYFNFLISKGVVVDCTLVPVETPLLWAAQTAMAKEVFGFEIMAYRDYFWASDALGVDIILDEYIAGLRAVIEKIPVDLADFPEIE